MKVQINRKHFVEISNIIKIVESSVDVRVHVIGYPRILKANCTKSTLLLRMVNAGVPEKRIKELR